MTYVIVVVGRAALDVTPIEKRALTNRFRGGDTVYYQGSSTPVGLLQDCLTLRAAAVLLPQGVDADDELVRSLLENKTFTERYPLLTLALSPKGVLAVIRPNGELVAAPILTKIAAPQHV